MEELTEGIDFINAYSKSNLAIGRMMSNFYHYEIKTDYGVFQSVEALYHYLLLPNIPEKEILKSLYGYQAKPTGNTLFSQFGVIQPIKNFNEVILQSCKQKMLANIFMFVPKFKTLSIVHFYNYYGKIVVPKNCEWWVDDLNGIKDEIYQKYI